MEAILVEASDKTSVNLSDFSWEYHTEELSTTYYFIIIDDTLDTKHSRLSDFNLYPIKDDIFNGEARFFEQVKFIKDKNNMVTSCKASTGRIRNSYF